MYPISVSLCCYGCIRETIQLRQGSLQVRFDSKIKAVCADFRFKLESIQTENAWLLQMKRAFPQARVLFSAIRSRKKSPVRLSVSAVLVSATYEWRRTSDLFPCPLTCRELWQTVSK